MDRELPVYDEDPFVVVSLFHAGVEKHSLNMNLIMQRFIEGDVSRSVWGPIAWRILHGTRFEKTERLLRCWEHVLPCEVCTNT